MTSLGQLREEELAVYRAQAWAQVEAEINRVKNLKALEMDHVLDGYEYERKESHNG